MRNKSEDERKEKAVFFLKFKKSAQTVKSLLELCFSVPGRKWKSSQVFWKSLERWPPFRYLRLTVVLKSVRTINEQLFIYLFSAVFVFFWAHLM